MATYKVKENIYSVGILNPSMRIFDVVMRTEYGTSYNSYIVKGSEKTALIETCHASFLTEYIKNIKEVCEPESIDYIILNHSEPDHSGVLNEIVKLCPKAEIYVSKPGSIYLKNITNNPSLPIKIAADQSTLDLGGKVLKFIAAPFLHWPDSMFTYIESDKLLFSCDFFGTHYCEPYVFDYNMVYSYKYKIELKSYYDAIFKPFRPYVVKGLEKYDLLDVDTICASHGPILTKGSELEYVVDKYREWSIEPKQEVKEIPIFFGSAYNNTKKIAEAIKSGILKILPDAKTEIYDLNEHCMDFLSENLMHLLPLP